MAPPVDALQPMLATLVDPSSWLAADRQDWVVERKLDGLRCIAVRRGDRVELWSRNHNSFLARFPEVAEALRGWAVDDVVLDGELVAHDGSDFAGFGQLQQHGATLRVVFGVFDLLHLAGEDTARLTLPERKELLSRVVEPGPHVQLVPELDGAPAELLQTACRDGWEGLVAKRTASRYVAGRSPDWVKLKCTASQELVVGGWTEPRGAREHLGALLVGYFDRGPDGNGSLRYAGKVGTGFTAATLAALAAELAPLERPDPPFADRVREPTAHWVEPRLVAEVAFTEWTRDGRLRHPRFQGLRTDKDAAAVVRERPVPGAS
jgi:DNA ligase D-like protein (predicted ligase)